MVRDKYEKILSQFELYHPTLYKQSVDWWASGRMAITVKLSNGELFEYNQLENTIRRVQTETDLDEGNMTKSFGKNLQKHIPLCGMSHGELAEKLGITNAMLSRYIHGNSSPSVVKAFRIAKAIGCTVDELFDCNYAEQKGSEIDD
jgi:ribosome-binding protein aMBF1 (putative translation factor)